MNPGLVVKLRPTGPWRIGSDSGARNRVDVIYHSDSLYSAITSAMLRLGALEDWLNATARSETPAVCFSSCFPFLDEVGLVIPPRTVWPPTSPALLSARVRWKSARFVPLGVVQALLAGQSLDDTHWTVDGPSECLLPAGKSGPFRTSVRFNAAVDRLTGASERHSTACIEFRPGAGLWTIVSFADEPARARWSDTLKTAFRLLADSGFGGERSRGWGRSEMPEFVEGLLPDMILGVAPLPQPAEGPTPEPLPEPEPLPLPVEPPAEQPPPIPPVKEPPLEQPRMEEPLAAEVRSPEDTAPLKVESASEPSPVATVEPPAEEPSSAPPIDEPPVEQPPLEEPPAGSATPEQSAPLKIEDASEPSPVPPIEPPAEEPSPVPPIGEPPVEQPPLEEPPAGPPAPDPDPTLPLPEPQSQQPLISEEGPLPPVAAETEPPEPKPAASPVPVPRTPAPSVKGHPHWMLSLFTPASSDTVDWGRGNYTLLARGGRVESPAGSGELKKQLQMVSEGSVIYASAAPSGSAPDVAPEGFAHPVFRAGFAMAIRLPEVS